MQPRQIIKRIVFVVLVAPAILLMIVWWIVTGQMQDYAQNLFNWSIK